MKPRVTGNAAKEFAAESSGGFHQQDDLGYLAHANWSPKKSCQHDSKMSNLRNHSMAGGGNQPLEPHLSSKRSISCKSLSFARFSARCRNPKEFWGEAVDDIRSMSTIMSGLSRGRCPYGCSLPSEIFCSGVAELRKEPKMLGSGLLFDNLVSDLQFFLSAKDCTGGGFAHGLG